MPVYREAQVLAAVLETWSKTLGEAGIDYELRVYDDGSPDESLTILREREAEDPRLVVASHANRGHGPTILQGYREARGRFVFQVDSDGELPAGPFLDLWRAREDFDFAIAVRDHGERAAVRRLVSVLARWSVRLLFGPGLRDPNCPYRLMRRTWLGSALARIPEAAFAPNILLAGLAVRDGVRLRERAVRAGRRQAGTSSLGGAVLWRGAWRAFRETLAVAWSRG